MFVVPVYRDDDVTRPAQAVRCLIAINVCIWAYTAFWTTSASVFAQYGFIPESARLSTAFTSMFLHANFWHIAGNAWFLWMFGRRVESALGTWLFTLVYLAAGLGGAALHFALNRHSAIPCIGASGAISGIVGCFFIFFPRARFDLEFYLGWWCVKSIPARTLGAVGTWLGEQTILGILSQALPLASVAFWAHIGGFLAGAVAAFGLWRFRLVNPRPLLGGSAAMTQTEIASLDLH